MITDFRHVIPRLGQRIEELGGAVVRDSHEITGWRMRRGEVDGGASPMLDDSGWDALGSWDDAEAPSWFRARVVVPERFAGGPVSLSLKVGGYLHSLFNAEALAYVDGELVQGLDAYHHDIPVAERAEGGREYLVALYVFWKPDFKKTDWQPTSIRPHPDLEPGTEMQPDRPLGGGVLLGRGHGLRRRVVPAGGLGRAGADPRRPRPGDRPGGLPGAGRRRLLRVDPDRRAAAGVRSVRIGLRPPGADGRRGGTDPHRPGVVLAAGREPVQDRALGGDRAGPDGAVPGADLHAEPGQGLRLLPAGLPGAVRGGAAAGGRGALGGERRDVDRARLQTCRRASPSCAS